MKSQYIDQYGIDSLPNLKDASKHKIEFFVTLNKEMLKDRDELEKLFLVKIRSPTEMLKEMQK